MARTRRVDCSGPGISRYRHGRGFAYRDADGARVDDPATVERIGALAIPPAWTDVWICRDPRGHIQATGIDAAGRKQYRYHDDWRARRDAAKFDAMIEFAQALPRLRRRVARDLRGDDLDLARINACAVRLLDVGLFRIGSADYAAENGSYGLTTLLKRHVQVEPDRVLFDYPAKSGRRRRQQIDDPAVHEIARALKRRRGGGEELLAHKRGRRWVDLRAEDVNAYLKEATGGDFSAKDFRTWNATALCAIALAARADGGAAGASRTRAIRAAICDVAALLGNTPAVCRTSYVDPRVIDRFKGGVVIEVESAEVRAALPVAEPVRRAVLDLIV